MQASEGSSVEITIDSAFSVKYPTLALRLFDSYDNVIHNFLGWDKSTLAISIPSADLVGHSF